MAHDSMAVFPWPTTWLMARRSSLEADVFRGHGQAVSSHPLGYVKRQGSPPSIDTWSVDLTPLLFASSRASYQTSSHQKTLRRTLAHPSMAYGTHDCSPY